MRKLVLVVASSVLIAACGEEGDDDRSVPRAAAERSPSPAVGTERRGDERGRGALQRVAGNLRRTREPSVRILTPTGRQALRAGSVTVSVAVEDFDVVKQRARPPFPPPVPGEGHVHFYLDTETLPTTHGPPATGAYRSMSATSYTWTGVGAGRHSLAVQLVGRDHAPLSPPAKDRITVEVE
jgi:hypothetical protein